MSTPHNRAEKGEIASTVLMPGDPLRAKYIAENYFQNPKLVNDVRGMLAYTGTYEEKSVSVMGSGMGMPSIGIYAYELFSFYDVENIIRVGSAGSYSLDAKVLDVVLASESYSESSFAQVQAGVNKNTLYPDPTLLSRLQKSAEKCNIPIHTGAVHSSDVFYHEESAFDFRKVYEEHGCLCVEMESFALFHVAQILGKKAAAIFTISDHLITHEATTAAERETKFTSMMEIALGTLL